ncbi:MAG TPA: hypothetical protein EYG18_00675 [Micavibrio sp.]|nr:hypothetical protein [Micavibrio sp.]
MAIPRYKNISNHWNYFLALEDDLAKVSRYIEFTEDNYETYSIELAHLLLAAASEVDVVLKTLCNEVSPDTPHNGINKYRQTIQEKQVHLISEYCTIPRYGLKLQPWSIWDRNSNLNPIWWNSYNKVKHHRDSNFKKANLKNALNAVAGLAIANLYLQKRYTKFSKYSLAHMSKVVHELHPQTSLLQFNSDYYHYIPDLLGN